jgi:hypothetical protein
MLGSVEQKSDQHRVFEDGRRLTFSLVSIRYRTNMKTNFNQRWSNNPPRP